MEHIDEVFWPISQAPDTDLEQANPNQIETADLETVELKEMELSDEDLEPNENPASALLPNDNENLITEAENQIINHRKN